jgi:hypothetical protein
MERVTVGFHAQLTLLAICGDELNTQRHQCERRTNVLYVLRTILLTPCKHAAILAITHNYFAMLKPISMSVRRANPRHITVLPGGGS